MVRWPTNVRRWVARKHANHRPNTNAAVPWNRGSENGCWSQGILHRYYCSTAPVTTRWRYLPTEQLTDEMSEKLLHMLVNGGRFVFLFLLLSTPAKQDHNSFVCWRSLESTNAGGYTLKHLCCTVLRTGNKSYVVLAIFIGAQAKSLCLLLSDNDEMRTQLGIPFSLFTGFLYHLMQLVFAVCSCSPFVEAHTTLLCHHGGWKLFL